MLYKYSWSSFIIHTYLQLQFTKVKNEKKISNLDALLPKTFFFSPITLESTSSISLKENCQDILFLVPMDLKYHKKIIGKKFTMSH